MKTIFYSKEAQFELTDEEFVSFIKQANTGEKVFIPRLNVFLSSMFIWAGDKPEIIKVLHDGSRAIKKFGVWVSENDPNVRIDLSFYPELKQNHNHKLLS